MKAVQLVLGACASIAVTAMDVVDFGVTTVDPMRSLAETTAEAKGCKGSDGKVKVTPPTGYSDCTDSILLGGGKLTFVLSAGFVESKLLVGTGGKAPLFELHERGYYKLTEKFADAIKATLAELTGLPTDPANLFLQEQPFYISGGVTPQTGDEFNVYYSYTFNRHQLSGSFAKFGEKKTYAEVMKYAKEKCTAAAADKGVALTKLKAQMGDKFDTAEKDYLLAIKNFDTPRDVMATDVMPIDPNSEGGKLPYNYRDVVLGGYMVLQVESVETLDAMTKATSVGKYAMIDTLERFTLTEDSKRVNMALARGIERYINSRKTALDKYNMPFDLGNVFSASSFPVKMPEKDAAGKAIAKRYFLAVNWTGTMSAPQVVDVMRTQGPTNKDPVRKVLMSIMANIQGDDVTGGVKHTWLNLFNFLALSLNQYVVDGTGAWLKTLKLDAGKKVIVKSGNKAGGAANDIFFKSDGEAHDYGNPFHGSDPMAPVSGDYFPPVESNNKSVLPTKDMVKAVFDKNKTTVKAGEMVSAGTITFTDPCLGKAPTRRALTGLAKSGSDRRLDATATDACVPADAKVGLEVANLLIFDMLGLNIADPPAGLKNLILLNHRELAGGVEIIYAFHFTDTNLKAMNVDVNALKTKYGVADKAQAGDMLQGWLQDTFNVIDPNGLQQRLYQLAMKTGARAKPWLVPEITAKSPIMAVAHPERLFPTKGRALTEAAATAKVQGAGSVFQNSVASGAIPGEYCTAITNAARGKATTPGGTNALALQLQTAGKAKAQKEVKATACDNKSGRPKVAVKAASYSAPTKSTTLVALFSVLAVFIAGLF